jgi:ppGpp synthetase/RelA/SpoT-type nucleotidyltranferase
MKNKNQAKAGSKPITAKTKIPLRGAAAAECSVHKFDKAATRRNSRNWGLHFDSPDCRRDRVKPVCSRTENRVFLMLGENPNKLISDKYAAAEQIARRLRALQDSMGPTVQSTQFYTRIRIKSRESIEAKVLKKQFEKQYSIDSVTDLVGLRIVTLYDTDLIHALDFALQMIAHGSHGTPATEPLFKSGTIWNSIREIRIYRRHKSRKDPYKSQYDEIMKRIDKDLRHLKERASISETKELIAEIETVEKLRSSIRFLPEETRDPNSGPKHDDEYSSTHLVVNAISYRQVDMEIPIEIQIRTAAEDIWGEINHKFLYKNESVFAWNHEIGRIQRELYKNSTRLKRAIDAITDLVVDFVEHDQELIDARHNFHNPSSEYSLSLMVTLIYSMSKRLMSDLTGEFKRYNEELSRAINGELPRYADCLETLSRIEEAVDRQIETLGPRGNSAIREICVQRRLLCRFEKLRLRTLAAVAHGFSIADGKPFDQDNTEDLRKRDYVCYNLFSEICQYEEEKTAKVRPLSVIFYFEYLAQSPVQRYDVYMDYLYRANEYIMHDECLPSWSIYRSLIPLEIGRQICDSVEERATRIGESGVDTSLLSGTRDGFKLELIEAFKHAKKALDNGWPIDDRTGDLSLGRDKDYYSTYSDTLLKIIISYKAFGVGENIWDANVSRDHVLEIVAHTEDLLRGSSSPLSPGVALELGRKLAVVKDALSAAAAR